MTKQYSPFMLTAAIAAATLSLAGCKSETGESAAPPPAASPSATGTASILRPDVEAETAVPLAIEPRIATFGFPEGGAELTAAAKAELDEIVTGQQVGEGWPITLGGHSDAGGNDDANIRASQARADAVADYLVSKGIARDRITTIAFGEQNPTAPNALPNGEPDEDGRAQNRRVDLVIAASGGLSVMMQDDDEQGADADAQAADESAAPPP